MMLVGQLGMSSVGWSIGRLSLFRQHLTLTVLTLLWLGVSGFCAGRIAARSDVVALVAVEVVTLAIVLLSVLMAAVEMGAGEAMRDALTGIAGMATVAVAYWMAQRSAPR